MKFEKIILVELYYKSDKENEDRVRIMNNFSDPEPDKVLI